MFALQGQLLLAFLAKRDGCSLGAGHEPTEPAMDQRDCGDLTQSWLVVLAGLLLVSPRPFAAARPRCRGSPGAGGRAGRRATGAARRRSRDVVDDPPRT